MPPREEEGEEEEETDRLLYRRYFSGIHPETNETQLSELIDEVIKVQSGCDLAIDIKRSENEAVIGARVSLTRPLSFLRINSYDLREDPKLCGHFDFNHKQRYKFFQKCSICKDCYGSHIKCTKCKKRFCYSCVNKRKDQSVQEIKQKIINYMKSIPVEAIDKWKMKGDNLVGKYHD